jgi:DNA-3-methyladenine glycosylase
MTNDILPAAFYDRPVLDVARDLLGKRLVRVSDGQILSGIITETEAYRGEEDLACHARAGRTPRTAIMYGPPGRAYIYFTYGMHWLLNCVTGPEGFPAAVLIRAIHPCEGLTSMAARRPGVPPRQFCNGPAKLCRALGIDGALNGADLCAAETGLYLTQSKAVSPHFIETSPRIGIQRVPEPWRSLPWRFVAHGFEDVV